MHTPSLCLLVNSSFLTEAIATFPVQATQKPFSKTGVQCLKSRIAIVSYNGLFCCVSL